jgi:hypothetical protein
VEDRDIDVLLGIPADKSWKLNRFEALRGRATTREVGGGTVYVAHLDDIIASKRVTNRPPDREALGELEALQARPEHGPQPWSRGARGTPAEPHPPQPDVRGPGVPQSLPPSEEPPGRGLGR